MPPVGSYVEHRCPYGGVRRGKVVQHLTTQFVYIPDTGGRVIVNPVEDWQELSEES